jgi:hypothetical protein
MISKRKFLVLAMVVSAITTCASTVLGQVKYKIAIA